MAVYNDGHAPKADATGVTTFMHYAGAALSLGLILGIGFWGYQLIMRDVSGIPVVRAIEGDMRVLPDTPGGTLARHTGLSVNEVAALGAAGGPEDRLVLAPRSGDLSPEDLRVQPVASDPVALPDAEPPLSAGEPPDILSLVETVVADTPPLTALAAPAADSAAAGLAISPRPVTRPAGLGPETADPPATTTEVAVSAQNFPEGTHLVQLGAFPTPALAAARWEVLQTRFDALMADHARVIQVSKQSSATWYRLRASGFADRAAARRLCTALQAEGAECIAVVVN